MKWNASSCVVYVTSESSTLETNEALEPMPNTLGLEHDYQRWFNLEVNPAHNEDFDVSLLNSNLRAFNSKFTGFENSNDETTEALPSLNCH